MRFNRAILSCTVLVAFCFLIYGVLVYSQPSQFNISNIEPNQLSPGTVFAVNGGQFSDGASKIYMGLEAEELELETFYQNQNKLVSIIPLDGRVCYEQAIFVKTTVNLNGIPTPFNSNYVVKNINCSPSNIEPAQPSVSRITQLDSISSTALKIEGSNLIPSDVSGPTFYGRYTNTGYPWTEVKIYNRDHEYKGKGQYQSFGEMRYEFLEEPYCGDYQVVLKNYFSETQISEPSNETQLSLIQINEYCRPSNGTAPPENGLQNSYEVVELDLPSSAYAGERFTGSVRVKRTGSNTSNYEMKMYVNDQLADTQQLNIGPGETKTYPLDLRFPNPGMYEIEIRVGQSYKKSTVDVQSQNGAGPPSNGNNPPTGGGSLDAYDLDGSCTLSDTEFFNLIDQWINEAVADLMFFGGVDAWIGQTNICSTAASAASITLERTSRGILFTQANGEPLGLITIFDINGQEIYQHYTTGPKHFWNMQSASGQLLANGVYFLISHETGQFQRFLVMR